MDGSIQILCGNASLCDGTAAGGRCESLTINGQALVQDCQFIEASWMSYIDRQTKSNAVEFRIFQQLPSIPQALAFAAQRREMIAGVTDLTISLTLGGETVTITAASAAWKSIKSEPLSLSARVTYPVACGQLVTVLNGAGNSPLAIPYEPLAQIAPLIIPSGYAAKLNAGEAGFYFATQVDGSLELDVNARCELLLP